MFLVALFALAAGAWLLDSAVKNRNPISTLVAVVQNPGDARAVVNDANGGAFLVDRTADAGAPSATGAAAGNTSGYSGSVENGTTGANSVAAGALAFARSKIGKPYKWGGSGTVSKDNPQGGYDCSGLMFRAYNSVGVSLPSGSRPTTATMLAGLAAGKLQRVAKADLKVGDLVFPHVNHVQMYAGNGKIVEAPRAGLKVREVAMWGFFTAARVKPTGNPSGPGGGM